MHPDQKAHWNYSDETPNGPRNWPKYFPTGEAQSPIDIQVEPRHLRAMCHPGHGTATPSPSPEQPELASEFGQRLGLGGPAHRDKARPGAPNNHLSHHHKREHLDSVGNELDSNFDAADEEQPHLRSPSTSSNNSNQSSGSSSVDQQRPPGAWTNRSHQRAGQSTRLCVTNKKIFLGYPRYLNTIKLSNTGHGWQVDIPGELASHTLVCGPPFGARDFRLAQFHCHWGADGRSGSEHTVNGRAFSAELHFVHWNCSEFSSMEEAARHKHGLAVLGVFVEAHEGEHHRNKHLDKILAALPRVRDQPHSSVSIQNSRLDLKKLFPQNRWSYATYEGSLTTPPLSECVDWLVFLEPIGCSSGQLEQFRRLKCPEGSLIRNCRPVQPLGRRTVSLWSHSGAH